MRLFDKRTPLQKEWEKLEVQEQRFLQKRSEKRESILNQKLEEKIPPKLQKTLDTAFAKAFALIFEKGTGVIEKNVSADKTGAGLSGAAVYGGCKAEFQIPPLFF